MKKNLIYFCIDLRILCYVHTFCLVIAFIGLIVQSKIEIDNLRKKCEEIELHEIKEAIKMCQEDEKRQQSKLVYF